MQKAGVIGLGDMGSGLAKNLIQSPTSLAGVVGILDLVPACSGGGSARARTRAVEIVPVGTKLLCQNHRSTPNFASGRCGAA